MEQDLNQNVEEIVEAIIPEEPEEAVAPELSEPLEPVTAEEAIDPDWAPHSANYFYGLGTSAKQEEAAKKARNTGKILSVVACFLVFALVFALSCVIASTLFSDAIQNGTFSFGKHYSEESGTASSEELNCIADIAEDVAQSTVLVFPATSAFGSDEPYGTGLIVGEQGNLLYIVTCYHLVSDTGEIAVRFNGSSTNYRATLRGYDIETDLCILYVYKDRIDPDILGRIKLCSLGDSDTLAAGDLAIVLGNPSSLDYTNSVSVGVISAANRSISKINEEQTSGVTYVLIQTDAAINPGDSGAPLLNGRGEVIGICNHYVDDVEGEGMGFAMAINKAVPVIEAIISTGHMPRPYLGIVGYSVSDWSYSEMFGLTQGGVVSGITPGGPADRAGIIPYDVIISFGGIEVKDFDAIKAALLEYEVGDTVDIVVYRFYQVDEPSNITLQFTLLDKYADKE